MWDSPEAALKETEQDQEGPEGRKKTIQANIVSGLPFPPLSPHAIHVLLLLASPFLFHNTFYRPLPPPPPSTKEQ